MAVIAELLEALVVFIGLVLWAIAQAIAWVAVRFWIGVTDLFQGDPDAGPFL